MVEVSVFPEVSSATALSPIISKITRENKGRTNEMANHNQ